MFTLSDSITLLRCRWCVIDQLVIEVSLIYQWYASDILLNVIDVYAVDILVIYHWYIFDMALK